MISFVIDCNLGDRHDIDPYSGASVDFFREHLLWTCSYMRMLKQT